MPQRQLTITTVSVSIPDAGGSETEFTIPDGCIGLSMSARSRTDIEVSTVEGGALDASTNSVNIGTLTINPPGGNPTRIGISNSKLYIYSPNGADTLDIVHWS